MLFNSFGYLFLFLPIALLVYFILNARRLTIPAKLWLVFCSFFFYAYWDSRYIILLLSSILFNFTIGYLLSSRRDRWGNSHRRSVLAFGVVLNLLLLFYFKYVDFFIENINQALSQQFGLLHVVLPLGISFFTFTQIAFLVDAYRKEVQETDFVNYMLFVTYFPHLLAGPILHHKEMMPQFDRLRNKVFNSRNMAIGLFMLGMGLFKKVVIADTFSEWPDSMYGNPHGLTFFEAWGGTLAYSVQLYFDFSGYTDMALGASLMFNIVLPENFNSPYKAADIQDFWRRWHMTLSRFLRDYIYIPLGGNKGIIWFTMLNIFITFLLGGIWHGAGWGFVIWGVLHGAAMAVHRFWRNCGFSMGKYTGWFLTFNFVNFAWVFFRAPDLMAAREVIKGMLGMNGVVLPQMLAAKLAFLNAFGVHFGLLGALPRLQIVGPCLIVALVLALAFKNATQIKHRLSPAPLHAIALSLLLVFSILFVNRHSEFLYFRF